MIFLTYSGLSSHNVAENLGQNDYSYFFVLQDFLPLLERFGDVIVCESFEDVDATYARLSEQGQESIFLSFTPPHKTPLDLKCPTVPVFAWEYSTIPTQTWGGVEHNDWRVALGRLGTAITHSSYSLSAVRSAVGEELDIEKIPAPLWDHYRKLRTHRQPPKHRSHRLQISATVIDSTDFEISTEDVKPSRVLNPRARAGAGANARDAAQLGYSLSSGNDELFLNGFYEQEAWGVWSESGSPWIMLPHPVHGRISMELEIAGHGANVGRRIGIALGSEVSFVELSGDFQTIELDFNLRKPSALLCFSDLDLTPGSHTEDERTLGIGLKSIIIRKRKTRWEQLQSRLRRRTAGKTRAAAEIELSGVVYTSVFNPTDGRKDWESIVTAFCYALGDREDATLMLKITSSEFSEYLKDVFHLFSQLHPFKCRIILIHGFLDQPDYERLIRATNFVVNTSKCEGQCLPLMEFMSSGKPAISPDNSAMKDYIDRDNAFVVESDVEPTYWPHDPRQILQTLWYRVSWESIVDAYRNSYRIARQEPRIYAAMSKAAIESLRRFCSIEVLSPRLERIVNSASRSETASGERPVSTATDRKLPST